ncbi:MAG TPA: hypothetical protein VJ400_04705 [Thermoplasmata archaeon]|nr:hypothetical protein [Thermoplasmata archaeon]
MAAATALVQVQEVVLKPALTTGLPVLDRYLGPFDASRLTLLDSGSDFVLRIQTLLCVRAIAELDGDVVFVDGGNSVDPHGIVRAAKRVGLGRLDVLPRIRIARAFTCHQMAALLVDRLEEEIAECGARLVVLSCLPELFLDEDVPYGEAHQLFLRSLRSIRAATESHGTITVATNAGLAKLHRRRGIRRALYEGADRAVKLQHHRQGVILTRLETGEKGWFRPVPPNQLTLQDFTHPPVPRIAALTVDEPPREVRREEAMALRW